MAGERGFAPRGELIGFRLILLVQVGHRDVRRNAGGLNRAARWRIVFRRRQTKRAAALAAQGNDRLHRALAKGGHADNGGAAMILQRTGYNFGGRGGAWIDQYDDGFAVGDVAAARVVALGVLGPAAAGGNDLATGQE